jgi:hypothetical protein
MCGQCPFMGGADLLVGGVGLVVFGVVGVGVVVVPLEAALLLPVLVELDAAEAPAMPEAAPPAARAPATIVAPSILDTFMSQTSLGGWLVAVSHGGRRA